MSSSRALTFVFLFGLFLIAGGAAQAGPMRSIETRGTLQDAPSGQISSNVWSGLSRSEALFLIDALPSRFASPVYFEIARRLLLSDAPSLPAENMKQNKDTKAPVPQGNPDRPDVLIARLDKLLEMGALRDAETLYDTVVPETPDDFDLAFRSLEILMLRGQLSAACLDLQAMQPQHGNNPRWKELNQLCRIQFLAGSERARLLGTAKFVEFPQLASLLRGRGPGNYKNISTEDLAFSIATGFVNVSSVRGLASKAGNLSPLMLSVLYQMDSEEAMPEKTCLAIESLRRGMISTRELILLYEKPHYDSALLLGNVEAMPPSGAIHPCLIPTVLYQRIASNPKQPGRDAAIRAAMNIMADLPDAALWPMATYFGDMDVHNAANRKHLWRTARVFGYEKDQLPESWAQGWGQPGVPPFWPVQAVVSSNSDSAQELDIWRQQWPAEAKRVASRDPLIPLLLGQSLAPPAGKGSKKTKSNLGDYDNILSLTFSRSYSIPSYGLTQRLADVIEKGQTGQSVALLLIGYGAIPPDQVIPHQMALVIEGLNKAGLGKYARRFALEVLR